MASENLSVKKYDDRNYMSCIISHELFNIYDEEDVDLKKVFENRDYSEDDDSDIILIKRLFRLSEAFEKEQMSIDNAAYIYARYCECMNPSKSEINWDGMNVDKDLYNNKIAWVKHFLSDNFNFKGVRIKNTHNVTSLGKVCAYKEDIPIVVRYLNLSFKGTAIVYYPDPSGIFSHICGQGALNLNRSFIEKVLKPRHL